MELSPRLYHRLVRPKWVFNKCIGNIISSNFNFHNKKILDFGCGVGSSCFMFNSSNYLGLDCDGKRIDYAKYLYPDYNFDVLQGNQLPVDDNSFDYIIILSVLHHIPSEPLRNYIEQFHKTLKEDGKIIVIEPCYFKNSHINNNFMSFFDKGKYIRNEDEYLNIFNNYYHTDVLKKYNQLFLYNKIFFTATPKQ